MTTPPTSQTTGPAREIRHPEQPDGIEDDSRDYPKLDRAARRVGAYIRETGDGLYDVQGRRPLYARDMAALVRFAEQAPATPAAPGGAGDTWRPAGAGDLMHCPCTPAPAAPGNAGERLDDCDYCWITPGGDLIPERTCPIHGYGEAPAAPAGEEPQP